MILFFDTETTGLHHSTKPDDHPDQPHIVELAAVLTDDAGQHIAGFSTIIDPGVANGVRIPDHVVKIHGIDEEIAWRYGLPPRQALFMFGHLMDKADLIVAHKIEFDLAMLRIAVARHAPIDNPYWENASAQWYCTQAAAKERLGSGSNLSACYKTFFGEEHVGAHGAWADVQACKRVYFHLKGAGDFHPPGKTGGVW